MTELSISFISAIIILFISFVGIFVVSAINRLTRSKVTNGCIFVLMISSNSMITLVNVMYNNVIVDMGNFVWKL